MLRAKKRIDKIIESCTRGDRNYDRIRLRNDAVVARAVLIAALLVCLTLLVLFL